MNINCFVIAKKKTISYIIKWNEKGKCLEKNIQVNSLKVFIHIQVPIFLDCTVMYVFACMYSMYKTPQKFCHALQKFLFILRIYSIYFLADFTGQCIKYHNVNCNVRQILM